MCPQSLATWLIDPDRKPLVMGILNVTPDSFSDGGKFDLEASAVARALDMVREGAAIIDVGGESTKPGSAGVSTSEQIARVVPAIQGIRAASDVSISIDTADAAVAAAALDAGATIINDISAGRSDPDMFALAAARTCPIVLMHMQGTPRTMQKSPYYDDVVSEVGIFLKERAHVAEAAGVARERIVLDVGIGFGKTLEHNLSLLKHHAAFRSLGYPLLLGTSRKGFIGTITGVDRPEHRLFGTAATIAWGIANGADLLRVHDVEAMGQTARMIHAIRSAV